jgi:hypothetical protein
LNDALFFENSLSFVQFCHVAVDPKIFDQRIEKEPSHDFRIIQRNSILFFERCRKVLPKLAAAGRIPLHKVSNAVLDHPECVLFLAVPEGLHEDLPHQFFSHLRGHHRHQLSLDLLV